ncbi:MAG: CtsR family transcriptional regulator [Syntrophomonadaceae bacterium]|nr:CtsR family transcriptional regulator [Syntrophomonadaceae bacterium]
MRSLTDKIECYLKVLIDRSDDYKVEIQRAELAETFQCAPSQITYVLGTRFTAEEGFRTESKRGGRGFIRIQKLSEKRLAVGLTQEQACMTIDDLMSQGILTVREAKLLINIINRIIMNLDDEISDYIRSEIIEGALEVLEG